MWDWQGTGDWLGIEVAYQAAWQCPLTDLPGSACSGLGVQMCTVTNVPGSCAVAGVPTQVLLFVQQSLYPPRHLPIPHTTLSKAAFSALVGLTLFERDV